MDINFEDMLKRLINTGNTKKPLKEVDLSVREKAKQILADFVEDLGLDGEYYKEVGCKAPVVCGDRVVEIYVSPNVDELDSYLKEKIVDEKIIEEAKQFGLIVVEEETDKEDMYNSIIHEYIHSNRNLLIYDAIRDNKNENAYVFDKGSFRQDTSDFGFRYADASQEILKANIDDSRKSIEVYEDMSSEELEDMEFFGGEREPQMEKQKNIDEALVNVMAYAAERRYYLKQKNKKEDIWETIEYFKNKFREYYDNTLDEREMSRSIMCEIILKHHDLELFNWMIDPITYSGGDIHYDFFSNYTKNDKELLQKLYALDISEDDFISSKGMENDSFEIE